MAEPSYQNWIHLDFKGMIPSKQKLLSWLSRIAAWKFSHVVFEYEDRLPWRTFEGTWRAGYEKEDWDEIRTFCKEKGLVVVPLIQTFGHLEWLLKHDEWKHLRCNNNVNVLCPEHPDVRPLLAAWIQEVAQMHPESPYIHVGLDEVYHMGECPACQAKAASSLLGKASILFEHAQFVCQTVLAHGKRPILWADMLIHHQQELSTRLLPEGTIICDWKYTPDIGNDTQALTEGGYYEVMGASAIRRGFPTYLYLTDILQTRIDNIGQWHARAKILPVAALIHTLWGRGRGLSPLYGPWEGWLPAFDAASNVTRVDPALNSGRRILEQGLSSGDHSLIERAVVDIHAIHSSAPDVESALRWWELSLRYHAEVFVGLYDALGHEELQAAIRHQGCDPDLGNAHEQLHLLSIRNLDALESDIRAFLIQHEWLDVDEYIDENLAPLRRLSRFTARP